MEERNSGQTERDIFDEFIAKLERRYGIVFTPEAIEEAYKHIDLDILYLVPDIPNYQPDLKPVFNPGFMTEDGCFPVYIRDEERAREEYKKLVWLQLFPMKPGKVLTEDEFVVFALSGGRFDVVRRNDANDDGVQQTWSMGNEGLREYYQAVRNEGSEIRLLSEILDEDQFAQMAVEGRFVDLLATHYDGSPRVIRGTIIGSSDGGGFNKQPLYLAFFDKNRSGIRIRGGGNVGDMTGME